MLFAVGFGGSTVELKLGRRPDGEMTERGPCGKLALKVGSESTGPRVSGLKCFEY